MKKMLPVCMHGTIVKQNWAHYIKNQTSDLGKTFWAVITNKPLVVDLNDVRHSSCAALGVRNTLANHLEAFIN
jgi:hypothetical protein